jgi:hypothetical protein
VNKTIIILVTLFLSASVFGQQTPFNEVKGQPEFEPASFEFSALGERFKLLANGRGQTIGGAVRRFNLRISRGDRLDRVLYHAEYEGDLFLICEYGDVESGAGFISRLDGRNLRLKWKRSIPAFNVGPGLIEGHSAYVTALGFIGKVGLASGSLAWQHRNLYRDNHFTAFELPRLEKDTVIFKEFATYPEQTKTITVDKRSGKLISVR